jgi:amino acid adenylation domain-containing protein
MGIAEKATMGRRSGLSAEQQALLQQRLRGAARSVHAPPRLRPREQPGPAPLSFAQQRLWFLDQLQPHSPLYNLPTAVRLRGPLERTALERAIQKIVARHESLRTRFVAEDGNPVQVVTAHVPIPLRLANLARHPAPEREAKLTQLLAEAARHPFDLSRHPLMSVLLVELDETDHVLLVNMHHIVSDAWSVGVFFRELKALYEAFRSGREAQLPGLPVQYRDYAIWQREWMQDGTMASQLAYWKSHLEGAPSVLELPSARPRPAVQTFTGDHASRELSPALTAALKRLSQTEGATLFMTLLAAFKLLLHRYTRQTNIVVGTPIAGRHLLETEGLIGFFVNTLALHTNLSGNPTFKELLARVRQGALDGMSHQDLPFERLVEELQPVRSSSYTPLVQVLFVFQNEAPPVLPGPDLTASPLPLETATSKFDLTVAVEERQGQLLATVEYSTALFDPDAIERLLSHFQTLLESVVANPAQKISQLPMLSAAERQQVLVTWNETTTGYPRSEIIPKLFEQQVEQCPDSVAIVFDDQSSTYRALNQKANQLARYLQRLQVGPGANVCLCLQRSPELLVSLLAILKAGGAYVSLDPAHPKERLAFMLDDVQARVVLTTTALQSALPALASSAVDHAPGTPKVLCLDAAWDAISREDASNLPGTATPESPAYVSFTSGSTGRPKGVCVPHRGVVRLVRGANYIDFGPHETFLQLAPVAFDASTLEIWGPLLNGGRLVLFPPGVPTLTELGEFIQRQRITTLWLTAGWFHQMVEESVEGLRGVRQLLAGGDVLSVPHVKKALDCLPDCVLVNGYGPTENTTFTSCHRITRADTERRSIPIGRPIANTKTFILDEDRQPVPIGVPGEVYVGGDGLALGYLNQPELTAEKFVRHALGPGSETRLYRTGDLAQWLPDGSLEFLGRIDNQLKIRGFRVELGEIEAVLHQHPAVCECAVAAHLDASHNKQLTAYFVTSADVPPTAEELREHLQRSLPEYMVPTAFVRLASLPLNSNGKVERSALPPPELSFPQSDEKIISPRDALERKLAALWEEVLGLKPIGATSHFFELGGHSLMAVRLVARIEKAFDKKLPVSAVFQSPTVAQLAMVLRDRQEGAAHSNLVTIQPRGDKPPLYLVHGVGGGMFWGYTNLARYLGPDQPLHAFSSRGLDGHEEFARIEQMAAHYVAQLRAAQPQGPYYIGGYCFGGVIAYEMARQLRRQGAAVGLLALINCAPPNSSYTQLHFSSASVLKFLKNLLYWSGYLWHLNLHQQRDLVRWRLRAMRKKFTRLLGPSRARLEKFDVDELVDLSAQPAERRTLWETHIRALLRYKPGHYDGRVTLFRTRGHSLLCSFDDSYGWGELAAGGVTVKIIPGDHESILVEPNVQLVAEALMQCLGLNL